jgi:putative DNA methylase
MASSKNIAVKSPRKLIEVALPLDKINEAAAREKAIRHGHPSTLHLWWARRPLAAARAVLFGQLVNDPGYERHLNRGVNKVEAAKERERLFKIIEDLVVWENTNNETVLNAARAEIWKSWRETCELNRNHPDAESLFNPEKLPAFHDPFAGGGAIPLEAQRLGLESYASDLNPVAVTINKAMIEIPPQFVGRAPIGPIPEGEQQNFSQKQWPGASGLAEDVRRYGAWMRTEAEKRIGHLYPKVEITAEMASDRPELKVLVGQRLTVIAWLWARTVKSPNPAYSQTSVPLISSFILSSKAGRGAYIEPIVDGPKYSFRVILGVPTKAAEEGTKLSRGANFRCIVSGSPIEPSYIKSQAIAGKFGARMMAIVAEGPSGRVFLAPSTLQESASEQAPHIEFPSTSVANDPRAFTPILYGFDSFDKLFTPRQQAVLQTFADLVPTTIAKCLEDAIAESARNSFQSVADAHSFANGVGTYLAFLVDQMANHCSSFCGWNHPNTQMRSVFSRQALAMTWDFAEANVFSDSSGSFNNLIERQVKGFETLGYGIPGHALQADAATQTISIGKVVSTDPPYYDNIPYADLSDFFYVWLRKSLRPIYPEIFSTLAVPKAEELVASPYRHGGKTKADTFFLNGMSDTLRSLGQCAHPAFPITVFYAFKQADSDELVSAKFSLSHAAISAPQLLDCEALLASL